MAAPFIGSWRLVSQHTHYPDGRIELSRGENADGIIIYDAAGTMAVQLMRTDEHAQEYTDSSTLKTALEGFLAYYGRYEVDEAEGVVRHFIIGSSFFDWRGTTLVRAYEFAGDTLTLKAQSPLGDSTRLLVWRRVA